MVDGEPTGMQYLLGVQFAALGAIWHVRLARAGVSRARHRHRHARGRAHLAFAGLAAREAASKAFADNNESDRVSQALGYEPSGTGWATRRGEPALLTRWKLTRDRWETTRRDDTEITGVQDCLPVLGL
jgi:hypothetical protein